MHIFCSNTLIFVDFGYNLFFIFSLLQFLNINNIWRSKTFFFPGFKYYFCEHKLKDMKYRTSIVFEVIKNRRIRTNNMHLSQPYKWLIANAKSTHSLGRNLDPVQVKRKRYWNWSEGQQLQPGNFFYTVVGPPHNAGQLFLWPAKGRVGSACI